MESLAPPGAAWCGHCALEMLYGAVALGGHIRWAWRDNVMYAKGVLAESNVQFRERARRVIEEYASRSPPPPRPARSSAWASKTYQTGKPCRQKLAGAFLEKGFQQAERRFDQCNRKP